MKADTVLLSSAVFTSRQDHPFAGGVAVNGNRILAVGEKQELEKYISADTKVLDFGDKLIMPGFVDAHTHYYFGAIADSELMDMDIFESRSEEDCVAMIKAYADEHPEQERVMGMGWYPSMWNDAPLPTKRSLDAVLPDRPVYLQAADGHTMWLNSAALKEAGVRADMKLASGHIGVFENGELNGLLFEIEACAIATKKMFDIDRDVLRGIHKGFLATIAANGITSLCDMMGDEYTPEARKNYDLTKSMERDGELTARLHVYPKLIPASDFHEACDLAKEYRSGKFRIAGVKGFLDGVVGTYTGYLLEPYSDRPETCGIDVPIIPEAALRAAVIAANKAGLPVRLHCIADGSVRLALNVFEESIRANGMHGLPNTVEHIESIHPDDIPRFDELKVIPSMQPAHLMMDYIEKPVRIGRERSRFMWPHRSILEKHGELAFGTDYPVVGFDPFAGLSAAVTRRTPEGEPAGDNYLEERIGLADALKAYTTGAAKALGRQTDFGVLEEGKLADIAVIDRNLFAIDEEEIKDCSIALTMMDGRIVYQK